MNSQKLPDNQKKVKHEMERLNKQKKETHRKQR